GERCRRSAREARVSAAADGRDGARRAAADASWFGAVGVGVDTQAADDGTGDDSRFAGGWPAAGQSDADSRFLSRQARRIIRSGQTAFQRMYRAFVGARVVLGLALLAALGVAGVAGVPAPASVVGVSVVYAVLALAVW